MASGELLPRRTPSSRNNDSSSASPRVQDLEDDRRLEDGFAPLPVYRACSRDLSRAKVVAAQGYYFHSKDTQRSGELDPLIPQRLSFMEDAGRESAPCNQARSLVSRALASVIQRLQLAEDNGPPAFALRRARRRYLLGWVPVFLSLAMLSISQESFDAHPPLVRRAALVARWVCMHAVVCSPPLWATAIVSMRSRDRRARRVGLVCIAHAVASALLLLAYAVVVAWAAMSPGLPPPPAEPRLQPPEARARDDLHTFTVDLDRVEPNPGADVATLDDQLALVPEAEEHRVHARDDTEIADAHAEEDG